MSLNAAYGAIAAVPGLRFVAFASNLRNWDRRGSGKEHFDLLLVTTESVFVRFRVNGSADVVRCRLFEDTTVSTSGTPVPFRNLNRLSSRSCSAQVFHTPTTTGNGNRLNDDFVFGTEAECKWVLKANTTYLLKVTNETLNQDNQTVGIEVEIHEPERMDV